ncbi:SDR family NAD(P)-dependent oxidoreductase [Thermodesulfobacteriota bacterium]
MLLSDNVAIITGGARGIGKGIAIKFAEEGCSLVIADILDDEANQFIKELSENNREAVYVKCDVSDSRQVTQMVEQTVKKYGKVDILVNNAGMGSHPRSIVDVTEEEWDKLLTINLKGVFLCCKAVVPYMEKRQYGRIINISSLGGISPPAPNIDYCTAKAGVIGLTLCLALELADLNICVNAIAPGPIFTEMWKDLIPDGTSEEDFLRERGETIPMKRVGHPEDVAGAALFYASSLSGYVTGDRILVGGGAPLRMRYEFKRKNE